MKHIFHTLVFCLLITATGAQTPYPPTIWNTSIASNPDIADEVGIEINDIAVEDLSGNVYVAASCYSSCTFPNGATFTPDVNGELLALASYDYQGNLRWAKNLGFIGSQSYKAKLCTVASGGICVAGVFSVPALDFGNGVSLTRNCEIDCDEIFMVRYNANGEAVWARSIFGEDASFFTSSGLTTDGDENLYLTGNTDGPSASFGSAFNYDSLSLSNMFLGVFNVESGQTQAVHFTGTGSGLVTPQHLAANHNHQLILAGSYQDEVVFENGVNLGTDNGLSYFVAGLDSDGNAQWVRDVSSSDYIDILGVDVDPEGYAYLAIDASVDLLLDNVKIKTITGAYAGIVLKVNESNHKLPVYIPYNTDDYAVMDVALDNWGNIYTSGFTSANINFGGVAVEVDGCTDGLITITNHEGIAQSARTIGGAGCEAFVNNYYRSNMAFDQAGFLHTAGLFFDGFDEDGVAFSGTGAFIAKFNTSIVGTDEPELAGVLQLYPNPSQGDFAITLEEAPAPNAQLIVYDVSGKSVYEQEISGLTTEIHTALPSGLYVVVLQDGARLTRERLVISR